MGVGIDRKRQDSPYQEIRCFAIPFRLTQSEPDGEVPPGKVAYRKARRASARRASPAMKAMFFLDVRCSTSLYMPRPDQVIPIIIIVLYVVINPDVNCSGIEIRPSMNAYGANTSVVPNGWNMWSLWNGFVNPVTVFFAHQRFHMDLLAIVASPGTWVV